MRSKIIQRIILVLLILQSSNDLVEGYGNWPFNNGKDLSFMWILDISLVVIIVSSILLIFFGMKFFKNDTYLKLKKKFILVYSINAIFVIYFQSLFGIYKNNSDFTVSVDNSLIVNVIIKCIWMIIILGGILWSQSDVAIVNMKLIRKSVIYTLFLVICTIMMIFLTLTAGVVNDYSLNHYLVDYESSQIDYGNNKFDFFLHEVLGL